jgi:hypothetical protein
MPSRRVTFASIILAAALPANAGMLYKSVASDGSVMFSDLPPPSGLKVVEQRVITANGALKDAASSAASRTLEALADLFDGDAALAKANSQVDLAEHALAVARRELWSVRDGLHLRPTPKTPEDAKRVESYKRDVMSARQALLDLLREKRLADLRREPGMPYVASR